MVLQRTRSAVCLWLCLQAHGGWAVRAVLLRVLWGDWSSVVVDKCSGCERDFSVHGGAEFTTAVGAFLQEQCRYFDTSGGQRGAQRGGLSLRRDHSLPSTIGL